MTFIDDRPALLQKARVVVEKAQREGRDRLTDAEQGEVNRALGEVRKIAATVEADAKSRVILDSLDAMAAGHYEQGAGQHIALTGPHMRTMAEKIIAASMRDTFGQKALVTGGTSVVSQILLPEVIATGRPAQSVLDVLPSRIVPPSYSFLRQSSRALAAAPVAAYSAKPVSDVGVVGVQNRLRVIATISSAIDHYLLSDNTNLERFVTDELVYGVRVATENQILNGDGVGENFTGVLATSGVVIAPFATDALTSVRKAITLLDGQNYVPSVIVLHAGDWEKIELLSASTGSIDQRGVPTDVVARRLWGVPVVINNTMPAKTGLVLSEGSVVVDTDSKFEVKWTDAVSDDVAKNQVRCRVEGRFGVSVSQPGAVVKVGTAA